MGTTLKLKLLKKRKKAERIQREIDFVGTRVCQEKCVSFIKFSVTIHSRFDGTTNKAEL